MNGLPAEADVIVVGAGPTGLALSAELRRRGRASLTIERRSEPAQHSRAAVVHARTLEVLNALGATPELLRRGIQVPIFRVRDRDRALITIDFREIASRYPFTLMCPQDETEAVLRDCLRNFGGSVTKPVEVTTVRPASEGVEVEVKGPAGTSIVKARYVVGCDGGHSTVRRQAGISFDGGIYEEGFVLADVRMSWPLERAEVSLFFSAAGLVVVAPLPNDRYRIVATAQDAPEIPTADYMQRLLEARGPERELATIKELLWASSFKIHHRVASTMHKDRILLVGDAAHVHSPAGGQGMNTGIQDAIALAEPLDRALTHGDEKGLVAWAKARRANAQRVVCMTDRMTRAATAGNGAPRLLRNAFISLIGHIPGVSRKIATQLAELEVS